MDLISRKGALYLPNWFLNEQSVQKKKNLFDSSGYRYLNV